MKYINPVVRGFYADPSVCKVGDTYYMVCSSMQYFPGVPLFESRDLVNWVQIGHCLTRESQIQLNKVNSSGGVFAPTIRYFDGRFYMVTTNDTTHQNFYVWTEDIYGEWSEPIFVDQGGIDPSLFFENGTTYFMSNGEDDDGVGGIVQCEIELATGRKLTRSKTIWQGTGGRYLEAPHLYRINGWYYLLAAEGGTEYGHMVTYARGTTPYGPFENYSENPVLTNRNLGGYEVQGVGHGDLIQDEEGNWWLLHLGFRQIHRWHTFHHLGREVFLSPVTFGEDGWFTAGIDGITPKEVETDRLPESLVQKRKNCFSFENTEWEKDWCYLRIPEKKNYSMEKDCVILRGTPVTLDDVDSPTFLGIRQIDFEAVITCNVSISSGEAGITCYMDEDHHYDLGLQKTETGYLVLERLNIGDIKSVEHTLELKDTDSVKLVIRAEHQRYHFYVEQEGREICLGSAKTRYLSSELAGGFTGVILGLYAQTISGENEAVFRDFVCEYK